MPFQSGSRRLRAQVPSLIRALLALALAAPGHEGLQNLRWPSRRRRTR